jgi:uncharacterized protein YifE (UPF0438 family)
VHRLWEPLAAKRNPPNGNAAKFSIPYIIAVAMLYGGAGMNEFEESVIRDPAVRTFAQKIRYVVDPDNPYPRQFTGHVRVTLSNGEVREENQDHFRGGREEPLSSEALESKFVANCRCGGWSADRAAEALAALKALRAAPSVQLDLLRGQAARLSPLLAMPYRRKMLFGERSSGMSDDKNSTRNVWTDRRARCRPGAGAKALRSGRH